MKSKTDVAAAVCAAGFIVVLAVSAYWDRSIRVLHVFEALPYALAGALCLRQNKLGYAGNIRALRATIPGHVPERVLRQSPE
jgi:hypothetical protein